MDYHTNLEETPVQDYQPGYSDDDDDIGMPDFGDAMQPDFGEAEEVLTQKARRQSAIPDILGEMRPIAVPDEGRDDDDDDEQGDGEFGLATSTGILSSFDVSANKNWIGPEYWRPSRSIGLSCRYFPSKPSAIKKEAEKAQNAVAKAEKKKKRAVIAATIDFDAPPPDLRVILEGGKTSINLPKSSYRKSSHLLPEKDYNFTADKITSLFTRPKFKIAWRKRDGTARKERPIRVTERDNAETDEPAVVDDSGEHIDPDAQFWAQRQDDQPMFHEARTGMTSLH